MPGNLPIKFSDEMCLTLATDSGTAMQGLFAMHFCRRRAFWASIPKSSSFSRLAPSLLTTHLQELLLLRRACFFFLCSVAHGMHSTSLKEALHKFWGTLPHPNSKLLGKTRAAIAPSKLKVLRSAATADSKPKYCTFTATCFPSLSLALCTCHEIGVHIKSMMQPGYDLN